MLYTKKCAFFPYAVLVALARAADECVDIWAIGRCTSQKRKGNCVVCRVGARCLDQQINLLCPQPDPRPTPARARFRAHSRPFAPHARAARGAVPEPKEGWHQMHTRSLKMYGNVPPL